MTKQKLVLIGTIMLAGVFLYIGFFFIITPDIRRLTDPTKPINYIYPVDDDQYSGRKHFLTGSFWSTSDEIASIKVFYKQKEETSFRESVMQRVKDGHTYVDEIESLPKGKRFFYYIEAKTTKGEIERIPPNAPQIPLLWVTFEGRPNLYLLVLHIILVVGAIFFLIHALYFGLIVLTQGSPNGLVGPVLKKFYDSIFIGWLSFTIGTVPLGYYVAYVAFGTGWGGIPIGNDITDNKTLLMVIYWGILLLLRLDIPRKRESLRRVSNKGFVFLFLLGILITIIVYMIPHSIFFQ